MFLQDDQHSGQRRKSRFDEVPEKRTRFDQDYSQRRNEHDNYRQPSFSGRNDPPRRESWRHEDPRNRFAEAYKWRSGVREEYQPGRQYQSTERRDHRYGDRSRRERSRSRSSSPGIAAPRIPRTPPRNESDSAPKSRHCFQNNTKFYRTVVPKRGTIGGISGTRPDDRNQ